MGKNLQKPASTAEVAITQSKRPAVVKDFVDPNAEIMNFLTTRIPERGSANRKIIRLYASRDGLTVRFRVNYTKNVWSEGDLVARVDFIESRLYEVVKRAGSYELVDITE